MQNVLITGGAGFIGSHLTDRLLKNNWRVSVIDDFNPFYDPAIKRNNIAHHLANPQFSLFEGDIRDREFLAGVFEHGSFDIIVHLAARAGVRPSIAEPLLYQEVNVGGTQNIFECCRNYNVKKCLFASSSSVYGVNNKIPFSETDPIFQPISPYAATKAAGELLAHVYSYLYGIQILCLRFFTVYGPRQRPDLAIHKFTQLITQEKAIPVYGDGTTRRDYTYIDDIIDGLMGALRYDKTLYEVVNLGNSNTVYLRDLIAVIADAVGKKAIIEQLPNQPGDVPQTFSDIGKAKALFGFSPQTRIQDGVKIFAQWYLKHKV
ncbi:MAG: GDP-mannose 4,6-dehydratase [Negativicutes bacterium]|nr:GDP-mannose 4,6-dehydratase [Negativicutes bacterium]